MSEVHRLTQPDVADCEVERSVSLSLVSSSRKPDFMIFQENLGYLKRRRIIDITIALIALSVAVPILIIAAIAVLLEDGQPVFFRQQRVGRFGKIFTIYKLRTMRKDSCADSLSPTEAQDPRVTRIGHWMRRLSVDELPQLLNVLIGDMTLVGPRPEMPFIVETYEPWQHLRHLVTPGITGFWQTTCRSTIPLRLPQATMIDLDYIAQASHATDAKVLLRTVRALITTRGAY